MKLDYHDLNEDQFERLAIAICSWLFGLGVQGFSKGPDGGKDGRFSGRAERFPSTSAPWEGQIVIQAKHTDLINRKFSDPDFASDAPSSILSKEIEKIKHLRKQGELDYYILFANRRMAGVAEQQLRNRIAQAVGIEDSAVYLCGEECMDQQLTREPSIARWAGINPFDVQPPIDPSDLARIIRHFADNKVLLADSVANDIPPPERRIPLKEKNQINGLSEGYARLIERYIKDFDPVRSFLAAPENEIYQRYYQDIVEELEGFILTHREERNSFDQMLETLFKRLIDRDYDLKSNKRLTRTVLYYMYWNCDLGSEDA